MRLYTTMFGNIPTFGMMPITLDCPFSEVIWDREFKRLVVVSKEKRDTFKMIPVLDGDGQEKVNRATGKTLKERKLIPLSVEFSIFSEKEVTEFINIFATNTEEYDIKPFMDEAFRPEPPKEEETKAPKIEVVGKNVSK